MASLVFLDNKREFKTTENVKKMSKSLFKQVKNHLVAAFIILLRI